MVSCCPRRELFREYGLGGPGVRGFWIGAGLLNLGGAGLANLGGAPIALLENPDGATPPFLPGVVAPLGFCRYGDSGRERDGLPIVLNPGLGARAPGPTDCENLGSEGVSGLKCGFSVVERLKLLYAGVVGVGGKSDESAEARLDARWTGRKMPDPGMEVLKYWWLDGCQYVYGVPLTDTYPSTSPSFFPRGAYCLLSSTPANTPFFPRTLPMNLTTPCMPPGTSTKSPTPMSCPSAPILAEGDVGPPVNACRDAFRATAVLVDWERLGDEIM